MSTECDVVVLGMGTCGEDASLRLARAGLEVVGVEGSLIGGECPFWACLPTKSMVRSANLLTEARRSDGLVGSVTAEPSWELIAKRIRAEVTGGWDDSGGVTRFEALGGRFARGRGEVVGPGTVSVAGETFHARIGVVVATGTTPVVPPIPGLAETPFWTNHEAVAAEELPGSLAILGGGAVGCEIGQVYARFGSRVTIVEGSERVLAAAEPEASRIVQLAMEEEGVGILTGTRIEAVSGDEAGVELTLSDGSAITADRLLVAVGRRGSAGSLGLENAGAVVENGFVRVDGRMRAAEGMWAIGDVTGPPLLTQKALYQGRIAIEDILGADPDPADYTSMPVVTFTDPEVGSVGLTEDQARQQDRPLAVTTKPLESTFRGWLHRIGNTGLIKLVADVGENRLVGATVVGPNAGEILGFLHLAVAQRTPLDALVGLIYAYPTMYGGIGEALGAYGRGVVRVLDPATHPMYDDPALEV